MNPILVRHEEHPHESNAVVVFAYFEGTPTTVDLLEVQKQQCEGWANMAGEFGYLVPTQEQDVVADRAGLERWCLWD